MTEPSERPTLRQLRAERGWTQRELAEQIARVARTEWRERVGVNADMVAKWERGTKGVSRQYRELLNLLFGIEVAPVSAASSPRPAVSLDRAGEGEPSEAVLTTLGETAALLDKLGPASELLQPKVFSVWKDQMMRRREMLKLISLAPVAAAMPAGSESLWSRAARPDRTTVANFEHLAERYQALYHSTSPDVLLTPIVAHLESLKDALRYAEGSSLRRKLLANRARTATLAGRLSFFDLQDPMGARGYYNVALESASEAGDHHQAAGVLGHVAFIPAADQCFGSAIEYLRGAEKYLQSRPHGALSSWLAAVESEIQTNAGEHTAALDAIDRARHSIVSTGLQAELPWFDYYDETRLAGFAGYASLHAGRYTEARAALTDALGHLPRSAVKQRAVFLTDLADVQLQDGDLDDACRLAGNAAEQLHRAGYATGLGRLSEFRSAVEPSSSSHAVRTLDDQLAVIA